MINEDTYGELGETDVQNLERDSETNCGEYIVFVCWYQADCLGTYVNEEIKIR